MSKFFFTSLFCLAIASAHAQSYPLEGTWTLQSVSAVKITGSDTVEVALNDAVRKEVAEMLSETLEFKADTLTLGDAEECNCGHRGSYERTGNQILITFTAAAVRFEYAMVDGLLHFKQQFLFSMEPPYTYQLFTVYRKQS